jgi:hypothetical protein
MAKTAKKLVKAAIALLASVSVSGAEPGCDDRLS